MVWHLIVDNQNEVLHVQSSGSNGGGNQDIADAGLEVIDGALPIGLVLGPMQ